MLGICCFLRMYTAAHQTLQFLAMLLLLTPTTTARDGNMVYQFSTTNLVIVVVLGWRLFKKCLILSIKLRALMLLLRTPRGICKLLNGVS